MLVILAVEDEAKRRTTMVRPRARSASPTHHRRSTEGASLAAICRVPPPVFLLMFFSVGLKRFAVHLWLRIILLNNGRCVAEGADEVSSPTSRADTAAYPVGSLP